MERKNYDTLKKRLRAASFLQNLSLGNRILISHAVDAIEEMEAIIKEMENENGETKDDLGTDSARNEEI